MCTHVLLYLIIPEDTYWKMIDFPVASKHYSTASGSKLVLLHVFGLKFT